MTFQSIFLGNFVQHLQSVNVKTIALTLARALKEKCRGIRKEIEEASEIEVADSGRNP
jgi:hypothetical protein